MLPSQSSEDNYRGAEATFHAERSVADKADSMEIGQAAEEVETGLRRTRICV
jgi:hypothetical protein